MASTNVEAIAPKRFKKGIDLGPPQSVAVQPIEDMPAPKTVYVPLKQHLGLRCEPKVESGQLVKIGEILGESADPESAPVHAPVSGKVISVADHLIWNGKVTTTVTIENDGRDEWIATSPTTGEVLEKKVSTLIQMIRRSGVILAGNGNPVHTMLSPSRTSEFLYFSGGHPGPQTGPAIDRQLLGRRTHPGGQSSSSH